MALPEISEYALQSTVDHLRRSYSLWVIVKYMNTMLTVCVNC